MVRNRSTLCLLLWINVVVAAPAPPDFLLPTNAVPKAYRIDLTIDPNRASFDGVARIDVEMSAPAATIWLNAKDLTVDAASVEAGGRTLPARTETAGGEFLALNLDAPVGPGPAVLSIRYRGILSDKQLVGPYRKQLSGDWYVFTTFTPIEARRAFPCFDEPRFKTPWQFTIHVPRQLKAFTNGRSLREAEEPNGTKAVEFARTEPLPAEVVAFAAGPFDVYDGGSVTDVPIRVITPRGLGAEGKEAANATHEVLPRLEAYTGIPYPYGKLDHVALPEGAYGAVENPGLITYRQRALLLTPADDTPERRRVLRALQAHEIGHQWFGDLVTQATWHDVWLSEGFATWFAAEVMDEELPPARRLLSSITARERIMAVDESPRTRPVRLVMKDRAGMKDVYNRIVYQKGAAVLEMLEGWLGADRFRTGLRGYLHEHRFAIATTADLAGAFRSAAGTDPSAVMHAFLDQTGIPVVRAEMRCEPGKPRVVLEQTNAAHQWTIPVCWEAEGASRTCTVLDTARREIELPAGAHCPSWIYPNAGGSGYYRSEWTTDELSALAARGLDQLSLAERLTLAYDLRAARKAGHMDAQAVDSLLGKLAADPDAEVSRAAREGVPALRRPQ